MIENSKNLLTRRYVMSAAVASALALASSVRSANARYKIPYGVAVNLDPFRNEPRMKELLIQHADLIVPMNALKWANLRHTKGQFDFSGADEIIRFAEKYGKSVHGHALLWYHANPIWLEAITSPRQLEAHLSVHIENVVDRYAGRIPTWDVVNEVVAHDPLSEGKWRRGIWYDSIGPSHVDLAFKIAARTDPSAKLFINDYDLEDDSPRTLARQIAILDIVRRLQDKNIPIHGVGLQAHIYAERKIGKDNLYSFIREIKRMGLEVAITELDTIDWKLPADPATRDLAVMKKAREFLSVVSEAGPPRNITTWGLNDRFSWIDGNLSQKRFSKGQTIAI